ncbi:hypothetical protein Q0590_35480 [Rhodocytophaga aerolata]|uniref:Uncharacterized protein n=1 Tax=Rhodocytophaga aerolata TaxID=455078 RepID=A0ABT8RJL3_9BACT|nr:hypothetical protein [Rhodocytophaga aerolata]MDO1451629.1 hypothetical protein [Rhodocytophaga aerolata]
MHTFSVERLSFTTIHELPHSWEKKDYLALLKQMDYENPEEIPDSELQAMCLMSLTDVEPVEAAQVIVGYLFAGQLSEGQIENVSHQMLTEKLWEEYPELSLHEGFFKATQLLYTAYNGKFPRGEAVQFQIKLTPEEGASLSLFDGHPEAPLLRLLAQGMPDRALLNRLFSEKLAGDSFEEARHILWRLDTIEKDSNYIIFEIVSSAYWLEDFKYAESYVAQTQSDSVEEEKS